MTYPRSPFSDVGAVQQDITNQIRALEGRLQNEMATTRSHVDRLEHSLREARAEIDGLRAQLQEVEAR